MKKTLLFIVLTLAVTAVSALGTRTYDDQVLTPNVTNSQVMRFGIIVVLGEDGSPSSDTHFVYVIDTRTSDNEVIATEKRKIKWGVLPIQVRDALLSIHTLILIDAENQGIIQPGTDSDAL